MKKISSKWLLLVFFVIAVSLFGCGSINSTKSDKGGDITGLEKNSDPVINKTEDIDTIGQSSDVVLDTQPEFHLTFEEDATQSDLSKTLEDQTDSDKHTDLDQSGEYTSKDEVALYIHLYGWLPSNFITKKEAKALGWPGGSLKDYALGKSIGGDVFGNYEGNLPAKEGRIYYECDIDTGGDKKRGAKRIVFSNDGLIYYTEDHYETFTQLYGEE